MHAFPLRHRQNLTQHVSWEEVRMTRLSIALIFTAIILAGCPSEDADPLVPS